MRGLPNPTPEAVKLWLKRVKRSDLHDVGWITVNKRFHGLTRSVRPFINQQYDTPEEREAAFDGLTLALMTLAHFEDIEQLQDLFDASKAETTQQQKELRAEVSRQPRPEAKDRPK